MSSIIRGNDNIDSQKVLEFSQTPTDNAIVRFDGTTGNVQNSGVIIDDSGNIGTGTQSFNGFGGSGFKNYIINGGMKIAQRKGIAQNTYTDEFVADRFKCSTVKDGIAHRPFLGSASMENKASMPCTYMAIVTQSTDINRILVTQTFEQNMFSNFNVGDAFTFSFFLGHNGTFNPLAIVEATVDSYNVVDSTSSGFTLVYTSPVLTNMGIAPQFGNKYTWTFNLTSTMIANGFRIRLDIYTDLSTSLGAINSTLRIGNVQLERGSVATPFENLSYALQYEQCRRYFRRYATQQNVNNLAYEMRTTPTEEGTAPYTYKAEL